MKKYIVVIIMLPVTFMIASCATSNNNLADDPFNALGGGGGYLVNKKSADTFEIEARTNGTLMTSYGTAREMWKKQADKVCVNGFEERDIKEYTFPQAGTGIFKHSVKKGFAICK